mmetsp:Transcript_25229/g.26298  ORF Transcript_25229/g.26298 Transcript_25229/m.26298 type:complete len:140 (-) Transcript_25229:77-496(-)
MKLNKNHLIALVLFLFLVNVSASNNTRNKKALSQKFRIKQYWQKKVCCAWIPSNEEKDLKSFKGIAYGDYNMSGCLYFCTLDNGGSLNPTGPAEGCDDIAPDTQGGNGNYSGGNNGGYPGGSYRRNNYNNSNEYRKKRS